MSSQQRQQRQHNSCPYEQISIVRGRDGKLKLQKYQSLQEYLEKHYHHQWTQILRNPYFTQRKKSMVSRGGEFAMHMIGSMILMPITILRLSMVTLDSILRAKLPTPLENYLNTKKQRRHRFARLSTALGLSRIQAISNPLRQTQTQDATPESITPILQQIKNALKHACWENIAHSLEDTHDLNLTLNINDSPPIYHLPMSVRFFKQKRQHTAMFNFLVFIDRVLDCYSEYRLLHKCVKTMLQKGTSVHNIQEIVRQKFYILHPSFQFGQIEVVVPPTVTQQGGGVIQSQQRSRSPTVTQQGGGVIQSQQRSRSRSYVNLT